MWKSKRVAAAIHYLARSRGRVNSIPGGNNNRMRFKRILFYFGKEGKLPVSNGIHTQKIVSIIQFYLSLGLLTLNDQKSELLLDRS